MHRSLYATLALLACGLLPREALGYQVEMVTGGFDSRALHLRVGDRAPGDANRSYTDGYNFLCLLFGYCSGGSPGSGGNINVVSATLTAGQVESGTAVPMTSNSTGSNLQSSYDGRGFCGAGQVYIGGFSRRPGAGSAPARLTVQANSNLSSGANTIPIGQISWTTGDAHVSGGTLSLSPVQIATIPENRWVEACMSFTYANSQVRPPGTYTARATFTLIQP